MRSAACILGSVMFAMFPLGLVIAARHRAPLEQRELLSPDEDAIADLEIDAPGDTLAVHEHAVAALQILDRNPFCTHRQ